MRSACRSPRGSLGKPARPAPAGRSTRSAAHRESRGSADRTRARARPGPPSPSAAAASHPSRTAGPALLPSLGVSTCAKAAMPVPRISAIAAERRDQQRERHQRGRSQPAADPEALIKHAFDRKRDHASAGQRHQRNREPAAGRRRHRSGFGAGAGRRPPPRRSEPQRRCRRPPARANADGWRPACPSRISAALWRRRTAPNSRRPCLHEPRFQGWSKASITLTR